MLKNEPPADQRRWKIVVAVHGFLNGITAGAIGLIAAIVLSDSGESASAVHPWLIFALALVIVAQPNLKWKIVAIILGICVYGLVLLK